MVFLISGPGWSRGGPGMVHVNLFCKSFIFSYWSSGPGGPVYIWFLYVRDIEKIMKNVIFFCDFFLKKKIEKTCFFA